MQVLGIAVQFDARVLGLVDELLSELTSVECRLKARVGEVLLEDHLVEGVFEKGVKLQVSALFLEVVLGSVLKLNHETHDLSLTVDALVSQHVELLFLAHEHPQWEPLFFLDDQVAHAVVEVELGLLRLVKAFLRLRGFILLLCCLFAGILTLPFLLVGLLSVLKDGLGLVGVELIHWSLLFSPECGLARLERLDVVLDDA